MTLKKKKVKITIQWESQCNLNCSLSWVPISLRPHLKYYKLKLMLYCYCYFKYINAGSTLKL